MPAAESGGIPVGRPAFFKRSGSSRYFVEPRRRGCLSTRGSVATFRRGPRGGLGGLLAARCCPRAYAVVAKRLRHRRGVLQRWSVDSSSTLLCWTQRPFLKNLFWQLLSALCKTAAKKAHTRRCRGYRGAGNSLTAERATAGPRNRACGSSRIHQRPIWQNAVWPKKTARPPRQCIIPTGSRSPAQVRTAEPKFRAPATQKSNSVRQLRAARTAAASTQRNRGNTARTPCCRTTHQQAPTTPLW